MESSQKREIDASRGGEEGVEVVICVSVAKGATTGLELLEGVCEEGVEMRGVEKEGMEGVGEFEEG